MSLLWALGTLLLLSPVFVLGRRAAQLRRRSAHLTGDLLEGASGVPPLVVPLSAMHLRTMLDGSDACLAEFPAQRPGQLTATPHELLLETTATPLHIPIPRIRAADYLAQFERWSSASGCLLRVRWMRAGERLETIFFIEARRHEVEKLRRELHLRVGAPPAP
jgi:hypothetical protein